MNEGASAHATLGGGGATELNGLSELSDRDLAHDDPSRYDQLVALELGRG